MSQSTSSLTGEYQKLRLQGNAPNIDQFVAERGTIPAVQLADLLILDQSLRWDDNHASTAEQYFVRFPELINHPESAIDLVYSEFLLPERAGLNPKIDEYVIRFPQYADELRRQDAFHRAIGTDAFDIDGQDLDDTLSPAAESAQTAPEVPGYEILGELGRGGIGVVYKARIFNSTGRSRSKCCCPVTSRVPVLCGDSWSRRKPLPGCNIPTLFKSTKLASTMDARFWRWSTSTEVRWHNGLCVGFSRHAKQRQ